MPDDVGGMFEPCQRLFHQRWNHLNDSHVRALAWLLDSPDLLDPLALQWQGKIASLKGERDEEPVDQNIRNWLADLDQAPGALHAHLNTQSCTRLGRYAEKLIAFYFEHRGTLVAHGVQVREAKNNTIGEFDFLLRHEQGLVHWEFATKFYLLAQRGEGQTAGIEEDNFVGPNLADSLGQKIRKIIGQQLALGQHPAAQAHLPQPLVSAQALVKGWLFYSPNDMPLSTSISGISALHCRGFWCAYSELDKELGDAASEHYIILPRLDWLAPAKVVPQRSLRKDQLQAALRTYFSENTMPVLLAILLRRGESMLECRRGFIVPDGWGDRAQQSFL